MGLTHFKIPKIGEILTRCLFASVEQADGRGGWHYRLDLTATELRAAAGREKNGAAARRMLALAMVLDGADRKLAAETCGMDRQTLRDWVHRCNV